MSYRSLLRGWGAAANQEGCSLPTRYKHGSDASCIRLAWLPLRFSLGVHGFPDPLTWFLGGRRLSLQGNAEMRRCCGGAVPLLVETLGHRRRTARDSPRASGVAQIDSYPQYNRIGAAGCCGGLSIAAVGSTGFHSAYSAVILLADGTERWMPRRMRLSTRLHRKSCRTHWFPKVPLSF